MFLFSHFQDLEMKHFSKTIGTIVFSLISYTALTWGLEAQESIKWLICIID